MNYSPDEMALLINILEDMDRSTVTRHELIARILNAARNTEDQELVAIAHCTIAKLHDFTENEFSEFISTLSVEAY